MRDIATPIIVGEGTADPPGVVSFSQLNMHDRCPRQYQQRYLEGRKEPPAFALGMGSVFHSTVEVQHGHKIETGRNLKPDEIDDAFADVWKKGMEFGGTRDKPEHISWREVAKADTRGSLSVNEARDRTHAAVRRYHKDKATKMKPVAVEAKVFVPFVEGRLFVGYIDCVDREKGEPCAVDTKLVGRAYEPHAARSSMQLTSYAWAQDAAGGEPFDSVAFHVVTKTKAPGLQVLEHKPSQGQKDHFLLWSMSILRQIDTGLFPGRTGTHCSWCGFNHDCPFYQGKKFVAVPKSIKPRLTPVTFETEPVPTRKGRR
jgi:hypothetical protein